MKTVEQKASEIIGLAAIDDLNDDEYSSLSYQIILCLKKQDRDTRHACAEAVIGIDPVVHDTLINKDMAHSACMNVKAV